MTKTTAMTTMIQTTQTNNLIQIIRPLILLVLLACTCSFAFAQEKPKQPQTTKYKCGQSKDVLDPLIEEAERGRYVIRRIETVGNEQVRYQEFNKRMAANFREGYEFTREGLLESINRISKLKKIYPIQIEDVEIRLNRENNDIDIVFCVKEKAKTH